MLEGDTVLYLNWEDLRRAIDYDLDQERAYTYKDKDSDELISHLTSFVSGLWQIHAFAEGNTRTTAVFTIQYLRSLGFEVDNDQFARHSWYFRNALVRANYRNVAKGIEYTPSIWSVSSATCCWACNGTCATATCISTRPRNGVCNPIWLTV